MKICIRKEQNGLIYIDKTALTRFLEEILKEKPYSFNFVEIDDIYEDCQSLDFNDDLTFNIEKYNARKLLENNQFRIVELKQRLSQLSEDIIQSTAGEIIDDLDSRKAEFVRLHNELRVLLGKSERKVEK